MWRNGHENIQNIIIKVTYQVEVYSFFLFFALL